MRRPEVEEFRRLASQPAHAWGMADLDVVHLCDYILHIEAQNVSMRRTFGSDPLFREKDAAIAIERSLRLGAEQSEKVLGEMLRRVDHTLTAHGQLHESTPLHLAIQKLLGPDEN